MDLKSDFSNISTLNMNISGDFADNINKNLTTNSFNFSFICAICSLSLTENIIVLLVLARKSKFHFFFCRQHRHRMRDTTSNEESGVNQSLKYSVYFVVNMFIANLLITSIMMPFSLCAIWWNNDHDIFSGYLCQVFGFCLNMIVAGLIFGTLAVTADRLYAVTKPMEYKRYISKSKVIASIGTCWVLSALCAVLPFTGIIVLRKLPFSFSKSSSMCFMLSNDLPAFYLVSVVGFFIFVYCLPLSFIVGAYIRMFYAAHTIASKSRRRNMMGSILKPMTKTAGISSEPPVRRIRNYQPESDACNFHCIIEVAMTQSTCSLDSKPHSVENETSHVPLISNRLNPKLHNPEKCPWLKNRYIASSVSLNVPMSRELTPCLSKSRSVNTSTTSFSNNPVKFTLPVSNGKTTSSKQSTDRPTSNNSNTKTSNSITNGNRNSSAVVRDGLTLIRNGSLALRRRLSKMVDQREENKAAKTSCIIIASFISLISPYFFAMLFTATRIVSLQENDALLRKISILLLYTNCAVTPAVYVYRDSSLRSEIRRSFVQFVRNIFIRKSTNSQTVQKLIPASNGRLSRKPSFYCGNNNGTRIPCSTENISLTTTNDVNNFTKINEQELPDSKNISTSLSNNSVIIDCIDEDDMDSIDCGPWYLK